MTVTEIEAVVANTGLEPLAPGTAGGRRVQQTHTQFFFPPPPRRICWTFFFFFFFFFFRLLGKMEPASLQKLKPYSKDSFFIRSPKEILYRHFIECVFAAQHLPTGIRTLLDFGSGGGFPGIPIALCRPEIHVTLGESQAKKAAFLREVLRTLNIFNAEVYNGRIESLSRTFQAVTLRAVDKMQLAYRVAIRNIAPAGYFALFTTEETLSALTSGVEQVEWATPLLFPASSQRLLLIGRYHADVPRGTTHLQP